MARLAEFSLIRSLFAPLATRPEALGLADDAAVIGPEILAGAALVTSVDALVAGVHFRPQDPPDAIAAKCLRVNLSDLAAMGAEPVAVFLAALLAPETDDAWMTAFAQGLRADLAGFGVPLLGGDTVSTPGPLAFSVTVLGRVPPGAVLRRDGARPGQDLWVSGTLGDAALGLGLLTGAWGGAADGAGDRAGITAEARAALIDRYHRPRPRLRLGVALRGIATAAMDISDGLCADAGHIARASGVRLEIAASSLPLSPAAAILRATDPPDRPDLGDSGAEVRPGPVLAAVLGGGDDYELLFTAAPEDRGRVQAAATTAGVAVRRIGTVQAPGPVDPAGTDPVVVRDGGGRRLRIDRPGWVHGDGA